MLTDLLELLAFGFSIFCMLKLFSKMSVPPWQSLIPIWKEYILFQRAGKKGYFWLWLVSSLVVTLSSLWVCGSILYVFENDPVDSISMEIIRKGMIITGIAFLIAILPCLFARWKEVKGIATHFHLETSFAIGLFLIPIVFYALLALDPNNQYDSLEDEEPIC